MRKVLLTLLAVIVILGALGAVGMTGYRYGYAQGISGDSNGAIQLTPREFGMGPQRMPMHNFGSDRDFGPGGFHMMERGRMDFGLFGPLMFLVRIAFWGLVIWAIYNLIARSGWRLTRTAPITETPSASVAADTTPDTKEE